MGAGKRRRRRSLPGPALDYARVRDEVSDGDVLLFQGTSLVSRVIRWSTASPYSHAGLAFWWHRRLMVAQSAHRGVELLPASVAVHRYPGRVDWWQLAPALRERLDSARLLEEAFSRMGRPYALVPLVGLGLRILLRQAVGNPDPRAVADSYFCSQLVSACYRAAGLDLVDRVADADTSPADLARAGLLVYRGVLHPHASGVAPAEGGVAPIPHAAAA